MSNTRIIERIKKLLSMAKGGTLHEKETALFQAQRLMAKHHIEEYQIIDLKKEKIISIYSTINIRKRMWQQLASVIAQNFRCELYHNIPCNTVLVPVFMGFSTDAEVANEIFASAYTFAHDEAHKIAAYHSYHYGTAKGVRDEWVSGFIVGLKDGFGAQIESSSETAVMIVIPAEVTEAYGNMVWTASAGPNEIATRRNGDANLYRAGYNNGYEFAHGRKQQALDQEEQ